MEAKFKKGDKVRIVPSDSHADHVREHYGKELIVENVKITVNGVFLYKVKDVLNYALERDLESL